MLDIFTKYGNDITAKLADDIKDLGFTYATKSGISISAFDLHVPEKKDEMVETANKIVGKINHQYKIGLITDEERSIASRVPPADAGKAFNIPIAIRENTDLSKLRMKIHVFLKKSLAVLERLRMEGCEFAAMNLPDWTDAHVVIAIKSMCEKMGLPPPNHIIDYDPIPWGPTIARNRYTVYHRRPTCKGHQPW